MVRDGAPSDPDVLESIERRLDEMNTPQEFQHSVKAHYTHLIQLAERLQTCGFDDAAIDQHVMGIFSQYEALLLRSIAAASTRTST